MNRFIKQLVESKYNFNIETNDDIEISNEKTNKIGLSKRMPLNHSEYESLLAYKMQNSLWDELNEKDLNFIKSHPNLISYVRSLMINVEVHNKKELKEQILFSLKNNDSKILNLNNIDVSNVDDISRIFNIDKKLLYNIEAIDVTLWDVSNVKKMEYMFEKFTAPVHIYANLWDLSSVKSAYGMFFQMGSKIKMSIDLSTMQNVETTERMCQWCQSEDILSKIPHINTSNVKNMAYMFSGSKFNEDISHWDVSNVVNMANIFHDSKFNQDISSWNIKLDNIMDSYKDMMISNYKEKTFNPREEFLYYLTNYFLDNKPTLLTIDKIPNIPNVSKTTTKKK